MNYRFDHLHLRSRDAIAAAQFYVEAFGAREVRREGSPAVSRIVLDLGGVALFIEQATPEVGPRAEAPNLGIEHLAFDVEDIDAAMAELERHGVTVAAAVRQARPGVRIAFIDAPPDGVRIELLERRPAG